MALRDGDWAVYISDEKRQLVRVQSISENGKAQVCYEDNKLLTLSFENLERIVWIVLL